MEANGWVPGRPVDKANAEGPHRALAQALMKRAIADIPVVTHIQKESAGMNKLYSQSMCSVAQWRAYQAAEAMVSAEVEDVRTEAEEIENGWSQVRAIIWVTLSIWLVQQQAFSNRFLFVVFVTGDLATGNAIS